MPELFIVGAPEVQRSWAFYRDLRGLVVILPRSPQYNARRVEPPCGRRFLLPGERDFAD